MHDPWTDLAALPGWRVDWTHVGRRRGLTRWADRAILLDVHLTRVEERCVLQHEVLHAERGPFPRWMTPREEEAVRRESARRLIPDATRLVDALLWAHDLAEAAEELDVDVPTLEARLRGLHPSERHALRRRLEE